jgi:hypothetical protein
VTLIDSSGRVRGDTDFPADALPQLENHASRPEVRAALASGVGRSSRLSASNNERQLYFAIRAGPAGLTVVRVSATLAAVDVQIGAVQRAVMLAGAVAILLAGLLAWVGSRFTLAPRRPHDGGAGYHEERPPTFPIPASLKRPAHACCEQCTGSRGPLHGASTGSAGIGRARGR